MPKTGGTEASDAAVCPHCGSEVDPEYAKELLDRWKRQKAREFPEIYWNPFAGFVETKPWHCIEEAIAFEDDDTWLRGRGKRLQAIVNEKHSLETQLDPRCLYCESPVDPNVAEAQFFELQHGFKRDKTIPPHCIEEQLALERADSFMKPGRGKSSEISRISIEKGISRDAARKWVKRHPLK